MAYQDQDRYNALRGWYQTLQAQLCFPFEAYLVGDIAKIPIEAVALHPRDFKIAIRVPPSLRTRYVAISCLVALEDSTQALIKDWTDFCVDL